MDVTCNLSNNAQVLTGRNVAGAPRDDGTLFLQFLYITLACTLHTRRLRASAVNLLPLDCK
jgi:hypothetical protein